MTKRDWIALRPRPVDPGEPADFLIMPLGAFRDPCKPLRVCTIIVRDERYLHPILKFTARRIIVDGRVLKDRDLDFTLRPGETL